jgi:hypothetical protein
MANEVAKGSLLFKEIVARIKGDDAEATAAKVARKAISAFNAQIAAQEAKLVDDQTAVENAETALEDAIYVKEVPTDNKAYCQTIVFAQSRLDNANATLKSTEESITYFKGLLAKVIAE